MTEMPASSPSHEAPNSFIGICSLMDETLNRVIQMADPDGESANRQGRTGIPTGLLNIDQHTFGLWPGEFTVVTGKRGAGMTSFATTVAVNAAKSGARVLFVALESDAVETAIRMCASEGRLAVQRLFGGLRAADDWLTFTDAIGELSKLDMYICDDVRITAEKLRSMVMSAVDGAEKTLIVIDGTELIATNDEEYSFKWYRALEDFVIFLKKLARESNSAIIATVKREPYGSRILRDYEKAVESLPLNVAKMADSILHIGRPLTDCDSSGASSPNVAEVLIAKHRMCAPTVEKLCFIPSYMRFIDCIDA